MTLSQRLNREDIVHKNRYSRPTESRLNHLFADKATEKLIGDTTNAGQHYYIKKFAADYSVEMTRSVQAAIGSWVAIIEDE